MSNAVTVKMLGTHHRIEVNGIRLHYTRAGSGEPLVLLHGFPMTSYCWRKIIPALAERFTVLAPDLRGCGDSDRPTSGRLPRTSTGLCSVSAWGRSTWSATMSE